MVQPYQTGYDLATQLKQVYITWPKFEILLVILSRPSLSYPTLPMTYNDLATQFKQIYITQPKRLIWNLNFQNRIKWAI